MLLFVVVFTALADAAIAQTSTPTITSFKAVNGNKRLEAKGTSTASKVVLRFILADGTSIGDFRTSVDQFGRWTGSIDTSATYGPGLYTVYVWDEPTYDAGGSSTSAQLTISNIPAVEDEGGVPPTP